MNKASGKEKIKKALKTGIANAKKADELQKETGVDNSRTQEPIRGIIRELIAEGLPIGSLPECGYWIIDNREELNRVIKNLKSRTKGIQSRIYEIRKAFRSACC